MQFLYLHKNTTTLTIEKIKSDTTQCEPFVYNIYFRKNMSKLAI